MSDVDAVTDPRALAAHPDPRPHLDRLARRPLHRLPDGWFVAARPDDVDTLLDHPAATIALVPSPGDPIAALQSRMARFSDGDTHRVRRAETEALLRVLDPGDLRRATSRVVAAALEPGRFDVMPLARRVPATVLVRALGLPDAESAVDAVDGLSRRLAPATGEVPRPGAAEVADALAWAFGSLEDDATVCRIAVLFQAMDATAALVATAVSERHGPANVRPAGTGPADGGPSVPPIMLTTRALSAAAVVDRVTLPANARVLLHLGAANTGSRGGYSFGRGRHACPGPDLATAIAAGFVDALVAHDAVPAEGSPEAYEPRPNLRIPVSLIVQVGGAR